jgi:hypothetical protein
MTSKYLLQFDPYRNESGDVTEDANEYSKRMLKLLPNWPTEVLIEWLHRHNKECYRYEQLGFENFIFKKELWHLEAIPNREAFWNPKFCDNFKDVERRATKSAFVDWLAQYMLENGTWNTPPIFLQNESGEIQIDGSKYIKSPYHLLEGHRRLSFLNGLREIGKAHKEHFVWIVEIR